MARVVFLSLLPCLFVANCLGKFDNSKQEAMQGVLTARDTGVWLRDLSEVNATSDEAKYFIVREVLNSSSGSPSQIMSLNNEAGFRDAGYAPVNVSQKCWTSMQQYLSALLSGQFWAISLLDAAGKIPTGVFEGAFTWPGTYNQCLKIKASGVAPAFGGRYCTAAVGVASPYIPRQLTGGAAGLLLTVGLCIPDTCTAGDLYGMVNAGIYLIPKTAKVGAKLFSSTCQNPDKPLDGPAIGVIVLMSILGGFLLIGTLYDILWYQPKLKRALELPDKNQVNDALPSNGVTLTADEYAPLVNNPDSIKIIKAGIEKDLAEDSCKFLLAFSIISNGGKILKTGSAGKDLKSVHGIRFISMSWVILGHTYFFGNSYVSVVGRLFLAISMYNNARKILDVSGQSADSLQSVHGIRFISMTWVILGHTLAFGVNFVKNKVIALDIIQRFSFQAILNATVSVDTFFLLSGLLLAYLVLKEMKRNDGRINWPLFYFHRFWRLTPPYMIILGFHTALFKYLGEGPFWPDKGIEPNCPTNWYYNLLYINNLVHPLKSCMGWAWYLANDMQFFVISPLMLYPLYRWPIIGVAITSVFLLASITATGIISSLFHWGSSILQKEISWKIGLPIVLFLLLTHFVATGIISSLNKYGPSGFTTDQNISYFEDYYVAPWCRIGPYLVGILFGYALYATDRKIKIHKGLVLLGWVVAAVCCSSVLYGLFDVVKGHPLSNDVAALYNAVGRSVWALGVGWVIFACCTGYGGFVNSLLSWDAIIPLSRLTYMAYLVHPIVIYYCYMSKHTLIYYTDIGIVYYFLGHVVLSYGIAFLCSVTLESPMMGLEKVVFGRFKR